MPNRLTYAPFYGGGWQDDPSTATPIIAAALQNIENGLVAITAALGYGGIFGDASDGSVTLDGTATFAFASKAGSVYTLTRDVYSTALTVNNGVTLKTGNCRMFGQGTLTNNGTITAAGNNAVGSTAGASMGSATIGGGRAGGAGGTGVSGAGGNGTGSSIGAAGGNGGAGTSGAAGTGGTTTQAGPATAIATVFRTPYPILTAVTAYAISTLAITGGAGGGGGGSDAASNAGGGGGSGGGIVPMFFWNIVNNGTITAVGGNGGNAAGGNAGGGGPGGGGYILGYSLAAWTAGTLIVTAGTPGNGAGTGAAGAAATAGAFLNVVIG